jgi:chorismate mutase
MTRSGRPSRQAALVARSGVVVALATLAAVPVAAQARADSPSPLTELVDAAAQRLQVTESVAAFKWNSHGPIEDPSRVQQELTKLAGDASAQHIDPNYVTQIFGDQINATEAIEYSRFADWKLDPGHAPAGAPDLSASRSAIDALNQTMLTQVVVNWDLLHSPVCTAQLNAARSDVIGARQLDTLYQQALALATRSYCA